MTAITLLTQQSCGFCVQAKEVLARLRNEYNLQITEVSLDTHEGRELGMRHGVLFAPGLLIEDTSFSYGRLSERKLRRELERRNTTRDRKQDPR